MWSVNDFSFATPTCDTCHLALLSHSNPTVSHAQPVGGNSMSPRAAQESPGSGRYRLADAWRATAQRSVGPGVLAEAGPRLLVATVLRSPTLHPPWALQGTLVSVTLGTRQLHFLACFLPTWHGDCPQVHYLP